MIKGFIKNQNLTIDTPLVASDTINYLTAEFSFLTNDWHDATKWAHFAQGDTVYDVLLENDVITSDKGLNLSEGVWSVYLHGNSSDGMRVTTEVKTFKVVKTGVLDGEPLPALPLTAAEQILSKIGALDNLLTVDRENLVAAINEVFNRGGDITPEQIADAIEDYFENNPDAITGGYYTPEVSQVDENTMKVSFTASGDKMPPVQSAEITLPAGKAGKDGNDYILTEADKQDIAALVDVKGGGVIAQPEQPTETGVFWLDTDEEEGFEVYTKSEIDAMFGSYITDIDALVGGDA